MALVLIAGGGSFGISTFSHPHTAQVAPMSAAVNDLQILDNNEQALQQVDQLLQENAPADDTGTTPQS
jgi:hypothetical protein